MAVFGFVASLALTAASMALQAASGKIERELEDLTKNYLDDLQRLFCFVDSKESLIEALKFWLLVSNAFS